MGDVLRVNINTNVRVRLTHAGLTRLREYMKAPFDLLEGNLYETQLWELMHIFGPMCTMASCSGSRVLRSRVACA